MSAADYIIIGIVALLVVLAWRAAGAKRKKGGCCGGSCSGDCAKCGEYCASEKDRTHNKV